MSWQGPRERFSRSMRQQFRRCSRHTRSQMTTSHSSLPRRLSTMENSSSVLIILSRFSRPGTRSDQPSSLSRCAAVDCQLNAIPVPCTTLLQQTLHAALPLVCGS